MQTVSLHDLPQEDQRLVAAAHAVSANAYAPYSGFAVGAAVRTKSHAIHAGANLENASYGITFCAEVSAITRANAEGDYDIEAIAVTGQKFTPPFAAAAVVTPCGRCRQVILEGAQQSQIDVRVICCSGDLKTISVTSISELLPVPFGPHNLGLENTWPAMQANLRKRIG